jgi:hypothetical protein
MIGRFKCEMCKHFLTPNDNIRNWKCAAFPQGIPEMKIAFITRDLCVDCNNGIGFEPIENNNKPSE